MQFSVVAAVGVVSVVGVVGVVGKVNPVDSAREVLCSSINWCKLHIWCSCCFCEVRV